MGRFELVMISFRINKTDKIYFCVDEIFSIQTILKNN